MTTSNQPVRFLLVEDDEDHAALVLRCLERSPLECVVHHCQDGQAALEHLRHQASSEDGRLPHIVLLDLNLPKQNGHEVLAEIRSEPALELLTVVILSTSDAESDRVKAFRHHANSYVVKPLDFPAFRELVADLTLFWGKWNRPAPDSSKPSEDED